VVRNPLREGRAWLAEALADADPTPGAARAHALTMLGHMECLRGRFGAGCRMLAEAVEAARQLTDGSLLCLTLRQLALYTPDAGQARNLLDEAIAVAREAHDVRELALALSYRGAALEQEGDLTHASRLYAEALPYARRADEASALVDVLDRLGAAALARGQSEQAEAFLVESLERAQAIGLNTYASLAQRRLAQLALAADDLDRAADWTRQSLESARQIAVGAGCLHPLQLAATLAIRHRNHLAGVRLLTAVTTWMEQRDLERQRGLWTLWVVPDNHADEVLRLARTALGQKTYAVARAEGAGLSLGAAVDEGLSVALQPDPPQDTAVSSRSEALTPREKAVASLVAQGLSNRMIAEQLVITEGTVAAHVSHILAKLNVQTRAQIAVWVAEHRPTAARPARGAS
jgi:DNA-binding CsgD family transcriptional regulator